MTAAWRSVGLAAAIGRQSVGGPISADRPRLRSPLAYRRRGTVPGRAIIVLFGVLVAGGVSTAAAPSSPVVGDWVGWAYFDEQRGDAPLRLRIEEGESLLVRFDELSRRQYDLPARLVGAEPARIVIERVRPGGQRIRLEGALDGDRIGGRLDWAGTPGRFELMRSPEWITRMPPETFSDLQGLYRLGPGKTVIVTSRFWGELLYTDVETGRQGTLFPVDRDSFFLGSAMYVPRPVEARLRFLRDADAHVTGVDVAAAAGEIQHGERVVLSEEELSFPSGDVTLSGTLLRSKGETRVPAAVVLGGSDWESRANCRRDAEILATFGLATFVYDRRGHSASTGAPIHSFQDDAADALAAVRLLRERPDILAGQVGVTGRSQGGWIAPLVAADHPEVAFLLLFVPPAVSPANQETTRRLHVLTDTGHDAPALALERRLLERAWGYASSGSGWDDYAALRRRALAAGFPEDVLEAAAPDDPDWEWDRLNMQYDPAPVLARVRCPVLALFGGADRNVDPGQNLPRMRKGLERAGNRDFELLTVPGANHGLAARPAGSDSLPLHRQVGFGSQGWPDVHRWLAAHLLLPSMPR